MKDIFKIFLTEEQVSIVLPLLEQAELEGRTHKRGVVLFQVKRNDGQGHVWADGGFIPHEQARQLIAICKTVQ